MRNLKRPEIVVFLHFIYIPFSISDTFLETDNKLTMRFVMAAKRIQSSEIESAAKKHNIDDYTSKLHDACEGMELGDTDRILKLLKDKENISVKLLNDKRTLHKWLSQNCARTIETGS